VHIIVQFFLIINNCLLSRNRLICQIILQTRFKRLFIDVFYIFGLPNLALVTRYDIDKFKINFYSNRFLRILALVQLHQPQKFHGLDHLRALAITLVLVFHYSIITNQLPAWLVNIVSFGWTGVDLFFVLSGFLIANQLFAQLRTAKSFSMKNFYLKRAFRILPAFLFTLIIYFCLPFFREREHLPPLWKFLTFTQNIALNVKTHGTFSHAWSLCVEEYFYIFLPIILAFLWYVKKMKNAAWLLVALFVSQLLVRHYSFTNLYMPAINDTEAIIIWHKYIYYPTYARLDALLVGVAIAATYQFKPDVWAVFNRYSNYLIALGMVLLIASYFITKERQSYGASVFGFSIVAIAYGCIVAGAVGVNSFLNRWQSKIASAIAALSYCIYLTHKGIIHMAMVLQAETQIEPNLMLCGYCVLCTLAALIPYLLIEKPFMALRKKLDIDKK
jgi:peptidoglycan/LPS O-acetylase OafA/YrhL